MKLLALPTLFILLIFSITWGQDKLGSDIDGQAAWDWSGSSVSLDSDGNRLAIGAVYNPGPSGPGDIRVFEYSSGSWSQIGSDIAGEANNDRFGHSVSIDSDGDRVAIGGPFNDGNGSNSGHVRVYEYSGGLVYPG